MLLTKLSFFHDMENSLLPKGVKNGRFVEEPQLGQVLDRVKVRRVGLLHIVLVDLKSNKINLCVFTESFHSFFGGA